MSNLIVKNGKIYTQDKQKPWAEGFIVKGGKLALVGSNEEVSEYAKADSSDYKVIDLNGKFVMPGIVDSHTHIALSAMLGGDDDSMPMYQCQSKAEVLEKLRDMKKKHPFSAYYSMFFGFVDIFENDPLTRDDIDKIVKRRPVILMDNECHSAFLNSGALRYLKISEDVKDLAAGYSFYGRDEKGRLTGFITEMTMLPILEISADVGKKEMKDGISKIADYLVSHGVTTVFDAGQFFKEDWTYGIIRELMDEGRFPLRMEVGFTRHDPDYDPNYIFPAAEETLSLEQLIEGYTINGAKQLRMEDRIGSIEAGKEADFLVLQENLLEMDKNSIHEVIPEAVYIRGEKYES